MRSVHLNRFCALRRIAWGWCLGFGCLAGGTVLTGQGVAQDTFTTLTGEVHRGELTSISEEGSLQLASGETLALGDLASIERTSTTGETPAGKYEIYLAGGTRVRTSSVVIRDEQLTVESHFGTWRVPLETMQAIVFQPNVAAANVAEVMANPSRELDTLIAQADSGIQSVLGLVDSVGEGKVGGEFDGQARTVGLERVIAIVAADLDLPQSPGGQASLECLDGSMIRGPLRGLHDGIATVELAGGITLEIPWTSVGRVTLASDRLIWLSDLEPTEVIEQPLVTAPLPWKRNLSVGGNRLALAQSGLDARTVEFDRGLGVQAGSRLTFAVPEGFNRFAATVGIDAETQGHGDCRMVLKGDGLELWSQRVRGGEEARVIQVEIGGVRELSLIVEPGEMLDLGDHADWANARFLQIR